MYIVYQVIINYYKIKFKRSLKLCWLHDLPLGWDGKEEVVLTDPSVTSIRDILFSATRAIFLVSVEWNRAAYSKNYNNKIIQ